jgi:hypothetical protein
MKEQDPRTARERNLRTGLILLGIALAFFLGFFLRHWK